MAALIFLAYGVAVIGGAYLLAKYYDSGGFDD